MALIFVCRVFKYRYSKYSHQGEGEKRVGCFNILDQFSEEKQIVFLENLILSKKLNLLVNYLGFSLIILGFSVIFLDFSVKAFGFVPDFFWDFFL